MQIGRRCRNKEKTGSCAAAVFLLSAGIFLTGCGEAKEAKEARLQGIAQLQAGQYEAAIASFETALSQADGIVDSFELDLLKYRGEAEYALGDYTAAEHTYQILAEVDGEKQEYAEYRNSAELQRMNQQGLALLEEKKAEEALLVFEAGMEKLLQTDSRIALEEELTAVFTYNIGVAYEAQGEFAKALEQLRSYASNYGSTPELEKEIQFLESRQEGISEWQN